MLIDRLVDICPDGELYVVGGAVRDMMLGQPVHDIDLAVRGSSHRLAEKIAPQIGGSVVPVGDAHNVTRIAVDGKVVVDIAGFNGTIEEDLARRDFTVNALAVRLADWNSDRAIIGDANDVRDKVLRPVSNDIFRQDSVRLLRALRLSSQHGLSFAPALAEMVRRDARLLSNGPAERVRDEFLQILSLPGAYKNIVHLDNFGLLAIVMPELETCRDVDQPLAWHRFDVLWHQFHAVRYAELLTAPGGYRGAGDYSAYFDEMASDGQSRRTMLKLTALLHDVGKPDTQTVTGGVHFYNHEHVGAKLVRDRLAAMKMSSNGVNLVTNMVQHHLRPSVVTGPDATDRAIHRFCRAMGDQVVDCLFLAMSDGLASNEHLYLHVWDSVLAGRDRVLEMKDRPVNRPSGACSFLNGHDLMAEMGIKPGPVVGMLLEGLREAEACGEIASREDALALAMEMAS